VSEVNGDIAHDPGWQVVGASVVGSGHVAVGRGCEDAHAFRVLDDRTVCLAVADGAGSARYAAEASKLVVQTALSECAALAGQVADADGPEVWESALKDLFRATRRDLETLAREHAGLDPSDELPRRALHDYATTLLVAIARQDRIVAAQVGDGATVILVDGGIEALTVPDHGEYINESTFLTSSDYLEHAQVVIHEHPSIHGVALLSDGLQLLALDGQTGQAFAPFFRPLFEFASRPDAAEPELSAFLGSARVCARTDDDKTLLLAVRRWSATDEPTAAH
jgi:hypothetical protein